MPECTRLKLNTEYFRKCQKTLDIEDDYLCFFFDDAVFVTTQQCVALNN